MVSFKSLFAFAAAAIGVNAAVNQLQTFTGQLASNPTNVKFYYYKPNSLKSKPGLLFAIHYCGGNGPGYFQQTQFANLADQYGYYVVYGTAPDSGGCWDVHSTGTLTHNGGGDSIAFASVVKYATANWNVDSNKVFATGESSGAMMTNVLMGAYPDLFKGGSAFSGVPYGCFAGSGFWNSQCAQGQLIKTAQQWGDQVRNGYPGYTGDRPKMQVWHGTADTTLYPQNFWEEIKEWTNVFGYSQTPTSNVTNTPLSGYSTATYGPKFQAILAQKVGHSVPPRAADAIKWFGLDGSVTSTSTSATSTSTSGSTTTSSSSSTPTPTGSCSALYGQCGGQGYSGPTCCSSGTCKYSNDYYSQCI